MRTRIALAFVVASGTVTGQQASYTYIAQPPTAYNPWGTSLTAVNTPRIGTTFQLTIPLDQFVTGPAFGYCHPNFTLNGTTTQWLDHFLLTGFSNPQLDLAPIGIPGFLFSSGDLVTPSSPTNSTVSIAIPMDPTLIGMTFYQQVIQRDTSQTFLPPNCTTGPYVSLYLSRGGRGVIGT